MMPAVIKIVERADQGPTAAGGCFVKSMDFDAHEGRGDLVVTTRRGDAKEFPDAREAMVYWQTISEAVPLRPDGKPNRPLTAYTVSIEP
jgi:hypothetical protein